MISQLLKVCRRRAANASSLTRALYRAGPARALATAFLLVATASAPSGVVLAGGELVARLPPMAGTGTSSAPTRAAVGALLVFIGAGLLSGIIHAAYRISVARLASAFTLASIQRVVEAGLTPESVSDLEDPGRAAHLVAAAEHQREGVFDRAVESTAGLLATRLTGLTAAVVVARYHWWAPLVLLPALGFLHAQVRRWFEAVFKLSTRQMGTERRQAQYLRDLLVSRSHAKEVRVFAWLPWMDRRIQQVWTEAMTTVWRARSRSLRPMLSTGVAVVAYGMVFGAVARDAAAGSVDAADAAVLLQSLALVSLFGEFGMQGYDAARAATAVRHLDRLPRTRRVVDRPAALAAEPVAIRFDDVSYRYPGRESPAVRNVSFTVAAGGSVAIVGENGAGKSTLVRLLCGVADPSHGNVALQDGTGAVDPSQRRIAAVYQRFAHYELSLSDNIGFGNPDRERDSALISGALDDAGGLPGRPDIAPATVLSSQYDGGTDLSGGQWQRVALARALYSVRTGAAGLLVLDEPTASLDVRAEAALFERLLEVADGTTTVLVTHRLSAVRRADRILVLKDGELVEDGTHAELIQAGGHYADLFDTQARRFRDGGSEDEG